MATTTEYSTLTGDYTIDPAHSRLGFVARHAMVTKVRGSFNDFAGSVHLDGDDVGKSSAQVTLQVASIDTRNADRDEHLRTNDFLAAETHPQITFTSTGATRTGEDTFDLAGDLTIKGVTKEVTVPFSFEGQAVDPFGNTRIGFEGSTTINRQEFGVNFNAVLETGGLMVSDKITLEFELSLIKQS